MEATTKRTRRAKPVAAAVGMTDDQIIAAALAILDTRVARGKTLASPTQVRAYLAMKAAGWEEERFSVLFLDAQHRVIELREMFRGTLTQTSVYPREIVKAALSCNAGAVILSHNHPSGVAEPSSADRYMTDSLRAALGIVDVRVLDHIIVAGGRSVSLAERGLV